MDEGGFEGGEFAGISVLRVTPNVTGDADNQRRQVAGVASRLAGLLPSTAVHSPAETKDPALILGSDVKLGKDDHEHEDVVDGQRLLEKPCREISGRGSRALCRQDP